MPLKTSQNFWLSAERRLARVINFGWILAYLGRLLVVGALLLGGANLLLRIYWPEIQTIGLKVGLIGLGVCLWGLSYGFSRKNFCSSHDARIRLEDSLGLHSRLSAAQAQIGEYPDPPVRFKLPVRWSLNSLFWSLLLSLCIFFVSQTLPLSKRAAPRNYQAEKPREVREIETWLEKLKEDDVVDKESLEEIEDKINRLLQRPQDQWYQESTMEGAQHLREQLEQELKSLQKQMAEAQSALDQQNENGASSSSQKSQSTQSMNAMENALKKMMEQGIKPGEELSNAVKNALNDVSTLTQAQQQQLEDALKKNAQALQEAIGSSPSLEKQMSEMAQNGEGKGEGNEEGGKEEGEGTGQGGLDRGPGEAPLTLKSKASATDSQHSDSIQSRLDLERVAAGMAVDERTVLPNPNQAKEAQAQSEHGGGARASTTGAAAPISPSWLPKEKAFLREVFK